MIIRKRKARDLSKWHRSFIILPRPVREFEHGLELISKQRVGWACLQTVWRRKWDGGWGGVGYEYAVEKPDPTHSAIL